MKKIVSMLLVVAMTVCLCASLTGCNGTGASTEGGIKVGAIILGDETEGYSKSHIDGIKEAAANLGIADSDIVWKYKVPESSAAYEAAVDLVGQGCTIIFSNSYGQQDFMKQAAEENPNVTFVAMTGDYAAISGLNNFKNAFSKIYEARYVAGVVAGLKLQELVNNGELSAATNPECFDADGNIKIGYVGAFNYAEVVSGYTAFFLGIQSVMENVTMEVMYTNSWGDIDKEGAAAEALVANGCVIIGQHADTTGAPAAVQKLHDAGKICYSVGYNIDMIPTAPTAALTSPTNVWSVYYEYAMKCAMEGTEIAPDFAEGYAKNAVKLTALSDSCAAGTAEKVAEVEAALANGSLKVFDTSKFTVAGANVTTAPVDLSYMDWSTMTAIYQGETVEPIANGFFDESSFRSAPYFSLRIDGIVEDADPVQ